MIENVKLLMLKGEKGDKGDAGDVSTSQMNTAITNAVNAEATARGNADAVLQTQIDTEKQDREDADALIMSELATKENIDTNDTYITPSGKIHVIKKHGFVHIWSYALGITMSADTWYTLATLIEEYRPSQTIYAPATVGNQGEYSGLIRVDTDGKVEVYSHYALTSRLVVCNLAYAIGE